MRRSELRCATRQQGDPETRGARQPGISLNEIEKLQVPNMFGFPDLFLRGAGYWPVLTLSGLF